VRSDVQQYGLGSLDWAPYRPHLNQRISVFAQTIAAAQNLTSGLAETHTVVDVLDRATRHNQIVIVLVDAWTTKIETYHRYMLEYDRRNEPCSGVVVPWNIDDGESQDWESFLDDCIRNSFPRNTIRADELFRIRVPDPDAFEAELVDVLIKAQGRIFRSGRVRRDIARRPDGAVDRPLLEFGDPGSGREPAE